MPEPLLVDTDILVDYLRGSIKAAEFLEGLDEPALVSVLTVAELGAGARGDREEEALATFLLAFTIVPLDADTARLGGAHRRKYGPSHGTGLADGLIAATALRQSAVLVTRNLKHYPMLSKARRPY